MKTNRLYTIYTLFSLIALCSSCYQDFEPDIADTQYLVINATAEVGQLLNVRVSHTWRYSNSAINYSGKKTVNDTVPDAAVNLYVNDQFVQSMAYDNTIDRYCSDYVVKESDKIRITASTDKYGDAEATETVPVGVQIDNIEAVINPDFNIDFYDGNSFWAAANITLKITFTDPADVANYYAIGLVKHYEGGFDNSWLWGSVDLEIDPIFKEQNDALDEITDGYLDPIFTDLSINGKQYTLLAKIVDRIGFDIDDDGNISVTGASDYSYYITFYTLSEAHYKYLQSIHKIQYGINDDLSSLGLAEPMYEYSNVSTKAGVVKSQYTDHYDCDVRQALINEAKKKLAE